MQQQKNITNNSYIIIIYMKDSFTAVFLLLKNKSKIIYKNDFAPFYFGRVRQHAVRSTA